MQVRVRCPEACNGYVFGDADALDQIAAETGGRRDPAPLDHAVHDGRALHLRFGDEAAGLTVELFVDAPLSPPFAAAGRVALTDAVLSLASGRLQLRPESDCIGDTLNPEEVEHVTVTLPSGWFGATLYVLEWDPSGERAELVRREGGALVLAREVLGAGVIASGVLGVLGLPFAVMMGFQQLAPEFFAHVCGWVGVMLLAAVAGLRLLQTAPFQRLRSLEAAYRAEHPPYALQLTPLDTLPKQWPAPARFGAPR